MPVQHLFFSLVIHITLKYFCIWMQLHWLTLIQLFFGHKIISVLLHEFGGYSVFAPLQVLDLHIKKIFSLANLSFCSLSQHHLLFFSPCSSFKAQSTDNILSLEWIPSTLSSQIKLCTIRCCNSSLAQCQEVKRSFRLSEFPYCCQHGLRQAYFLLVTIRQAIISYITLRSTQI